MFHRKRFMGRDVSGCESRVQLYRPILFHDFPIHSRNNSISYASSLERR